MKKTILASTKTKLNSQQLPTSVVGSYLEMKGLIILYNEEQGEKSNRKTKHTLRNNKNNTNNTKMINEISNWISPPQTRMYFIH